MVIKMEMKISPRGREDVYINPCGSRKLVPEDFHKCNRS